MPSLEAKTKGNKYENKNLLQFKKLQNCFIGVQ